MSADPPLISLPALTAVERRALLWLARTSIRTALGDPVSAVPIELTPALLEPAAAFVSLHQENRLRGCVGTVTPDKPLHETVAHMALCAAFEDPRFTPMSAAELPAVDIEISRLSEMVPTRAEQVRPGLHGVCVARGERRAVFLPQVASQHQWDRETLLDELCRKALLPADAWRQSECSLMVFLAEVFGEGEGG